MLADYKEGYYALKREGWDISHYTRAAKDTGYSVEFEPKSISKDFRTSVHIKSGKKKREKDYSKSSVSLNDRAGIELVSKGTIQCINKGCMNLYTQLLCMHWPNSISLKYHHSLKLTYIHVCCMMVFTYVYVCICCDNVFYCFSLQVQYQVMPRPTWV